MKTSQMPFRRTQY